jgi:hypothetical protein
MNLLDYLVLLNGLCACVSAYFSIECFAKGNIPGGVANSFASGLNLYIFGNHFL